MRVTLLSTEQQLVDLLPASYEYVSLKNLSVGMCTNKYIKVLSLENFINMIKLRKKSYKSLFVLFKVSKIEESVIWFNISCLGIYQKCVYLSFYYLFAMKYFFSLEPRHALFYCYYEIYYLITAKIHFLFY